MSELPVPDHQAEENKTLKRAVALGYDPSRDEAPRVIATAQGKMAEQIIAIAKENQIPIREDKVLTQALSQVDLDQVIPPELYAVVAEVLAFVYRLRNKKLEDIIR
jgi:flagellar biosynthesis protein